MDELERLPHSRGDALSGKRAAVDNFEHLVVKICNKLAYEGVRPS